MAKSVIKKINLNALRTGKEKFFFRLQVLCSALIWAWVFSPIGIPFISEPSVFTWNGFALTAGILLAIQVIVLFFSMWSMAYIRMTAVKVGNEQFPELQKRADETAQRLGLKETPDIFILNEGGLLNAFAQKLIFRRFIVLYSDLVDALTLEKNDKQLQAVLTHELAHHALGHCEYWVNYFISAADILYLQSAALSRGRESSADRVMKEIINDDEAVSRSLVKLAVGGKIGQKANLDTYVKQADEEKGFFTWFAKIHASHPFLPERVRAVQNS